MSLSRFSIFIGSLCAAVASISPAAALDNIKVMVFPTMSVLPVYAAQAQGFFTKRGLSVEVLHTPNSNVLREGLANGAHQIVHAAVDNAVAMAEVAKVDIAVVLGGDAGMNQLFVQPDIKSYEDLRGKAVLVDAPDTAFALLLYKMLDVNGLKKGDYTVKPVGGTNQRFETMLKDRSAAASILSPPFSIRAETEGLKSLGWAVDVIGPYQANAAWVLRSWGQSNSDVLVRYIQAYIEGQRWALNPSNKDQAAGLLAERLKLPKDITARAYELVGDPRKGFYKDAALNMEGFTNVLKLRAETLGTWGGQPPSPEKFLDLSYYQRALAGL